MKSSFRIKRIKVGQLQSNCYLFIDNRSLNTIVIDPGDEPDYISEFIMRNELKLKLILVTHGHFDHTMALNGLSLNFKAPIYLNSKDDFLLKRIKKTAKYFTGYDVENAIFKYKDIKNKNKINFTKFEITIINTPGHTPGSVSFYFKDQKIIFIGDLFFKDGFVGRYDFKYASKSKLKDSINKIISLHEDIEVYPGHGDKTTVKNEKNSLISFIDN